MLNIKENVLSHHDFRSFGVRLSGLAALFSCKGQRSRYTSTPIPHWLLFRWSPFSPLRVNSTQFTKQLEIWLGKTFPKWEGVYGSYIFESICSQRNPLSNCINPCTAKTEIRKNLCAYSPTPVLTTAFDAELEEDSHIYSKLGPDYAGFIFFT